VRFVPAIVKRNKDEPELRRAEVASIRAVIITICFSIGEDDASNLFMLVQPYASTLLLSHSAASCVCISDTVNNFPPQQKYDLLMCSAPAADLDCSGLFVAQWLMDAVAHAAEHSGDASTRLSVISCMISLCH
jgi:hypothetical protein